MLNGEGLRSFPKELPPKVLPASLAPNAGGDGFPAAAPAAKGFFTAGALGLAFFAKGLGCDAAFAEGVAPKGLCGTLLPLFWDPAVAPKGLDEKGDCFGVEEKGFDAKGDAVGCCDPAGQPLPPKEAIVFAGHLCRLRDGVSGWRRKLELAVHEER